MILSEICDMKLGTMYYCILYIEVLNRLVFHGKMYIVLKEYPVGRTRKFELMSRQPRGRKRTKKPKGTEKKKRSTWTDDGRKAAYNYFLSIFFSSTTSRVSLEINLYIWRRRGRNPGISRNIDFYTWLKTSVRPSACFANLPVGTITITASKVTQLVINLTEKVIKNPCPLCNSSFPT